MYQTLTAWLCQYVPIERLSMEPQSHEEIGGKNTEPYNLLHLAETLITLLISRNKETAKHFTTTY